MTTDPSVRPRAQGAVLAIAATMMLLGAAGIVVHFQRPKARVDVALATWKPNEAALAEYRESQAALSKLVTIGDEEKALFAALATLNRAELESVRLGPTEDLRAAMTKMEMLAGRYVLKHGTDAYRGLGAHGVREFLQALSQLISLADKQKVSVAKIGKELPKDPIVLQWNDWGGDFLSNAVRSGLVSPDGVWEPDSELVSELLFLSRWHYFVKVVRSPDALENPVARLTLQKWKIERHRGLTMERRNDLIREVLTADPTYPFDDVLGRLYARLGDWRSAAQHFERALALRPTDSRVQANLDYARRQLQKK